MFTATLVAAGRLDGGALSEAADRLRDAGCAPAASGWIEPGIAGDVHFGMRPDAARAALARAFPETDVVVQATAFRDRRVLVADMDSTMITVECIDELAYYAGIKPEVAAITERAMRGELDFEAALDARVALLAGMEAGVVDRCLAERVRITPGACELVGTMRARGATCVLVSGGFTRFAEPVGDAIGFSRVVANVLEEDGGRLTGRVLRPVVGAAAKERELLAACAEAGMGVEVALAVGDGANDLPMIRAAGLGVAFRAKPVVAAEAGARIEHGDLSALLYAQGFARAEWLTS